MPDSWTGKQLVGYNPATRKLETVPDIPDTLLAAEAKIAAAATPGTLLAAAHAAAIPVTQSGTVEIEVAAGATETNTLAIPTFLGQELGIVAKTLGSGGKRVVTAASAVNQTGNNTIELNTAGDFILLRAILIDAALAWRVVANDGCTLSTV